MWRRPYGRGDVVDEEPDFGVEASVAPGGGTRLQRRRAAKAKRRASGILGRCGLTVATALAGPVTETAAGGCEAEALEAVLLSETVLKPEAVLTSVAALGTEAVEGQLVDQAAAENMASEGDLSQVSVGSKVCPEVAREWEHFVDDLTGDLGEVSLPDRLPSPLVGTAEPSPDAVELQPAPAVPAGGRKRRRRRLLPTETLGPHDLVPLPLGSGSGVVNAHAIICRAYTRADVRAVCPDNHRLAVATFSSESGRCARCRERCQRCRGTLEGVYVTCAGGQFRACVRCTLGVIMAT